MAYVECPGAVAPEVIAAYTATAWAADVAPGPGGSRITPLGDGWAVVALYPSSQLVGHTDPPVPGTRYHVPIQSNPGCWVFSGGEWRQLIVGHIYAMDPTVVHGAVNWGSEVRLHLLVDVHGEVRRDP